MISNKIIKKDAHNETISVIEKEHKELIEDIFVSIKNNITKGKFYLRVYFDEKDEHKIHSLKHYFNSLNYCCNDSYNYKKDENNKLLYDETGAPIKDKIWLDIWWN